MLAHSTGGRNPGAGAPPARRVYSRKTPYPCDRPPRIFRPLLGVSQRPMPADRDPVDSQFSRVPSLLTPFVALGRQFRETASNSSAYLGDHDRPAERRHRRPGDVRADPRVRGRRRPRARRRPHPRRARAPAPAANPQQLPDKPVVSPTGPPDNAAPSRVTANGQLAPAAPPEPPGEGPAAPPARPLDDPSEVDDPDRLANTPSTSRRQPSSCPAIPSTRPKAGPNSTR